MWRPTRPQTVLPYCIISACSSSHQWFLRIVSLTLLPGSVCAYWTLKTLSSIGSSRSESHASTSKHGGGLRGGVCWPCLEHPSLILALDSFCFSSSNFMHIQSGARCLKTFGDLPLPYKPYVSLKYQHRPKNFSLSSGSRFSISFFFLERPSVDPCAARALTQWTLRQSTAGLVAPAFAISGPSTPAIQGSSAPVDKC
ncbi:hypothetical protein HDV64DRAFT_16334 [Trichoderma sp. TUCIM 5745]